MNAPRRRRILPALLCLIAAAVCYCLWSQPRAIGADERAGQPASPATTQPSRGVDERLVRKLLGGESTALDAVETTLARMDEAAKRLTDRLDPSDATQAIQKQILAGLDQMIQAAERNRAGKSKGQQSRRKTGRRPSGRKRGRATAKSGSPKSVPTSKGGQGDDDRGKGGTPSTGKRNKADLARQWGFLPQRDRLEVAQGFDEEFLPKFREQIQRYYRHLADQAQRSDDATSREGKNP